MNLIDLFRHGDSVLIATFSLLIGMSLVSWYVIFWKALVLQIEYKRLQSFKNRYVTVQNWPQHATINQVKGSVAILFHEATKIKPLLHGCNEEKRQKLLTVHLSQGLDCIRVGLDQGLTVLASVGTSAPFIGLLGTVWGIYGALIEISTQGNASLNVVAGPMGEALIATAIGLFAAIPAVLAYNTFVRANRVLVQQLRHVSEQLTLYLYAEENH